MNHWIYPGLRPDVRFPLTIADTRLEEANNLFQAKKRAAEQFICAKMGVDVDLVISNKKKGGRKGELPDARALCMYVMRKGLSMSYKKIGARYYRDHSTAVHAVQKIEGYLEIPSEARRFLPIIDGALKILGQ